MLTTYELSQYANKFLKDNYNMSLSVPLQLNGRLKSAKGRFVWYKRDRRPKVVELNKVFVENNNISIVLDVLRHELVHYALFMQGKPHEDGHPVFEGELKRLGIIRQSTIGHEQITTKAQIYNCSDCDKEFKMNRRLRNNGRNHRCKCGGRLIDMGKRLVTI